MRLCKIKEIFFPLLHPFSAVHFVDEISVFHLNGNNRQSLQKVRQWQKNELHERQEKKLINFGPSNCDGSWQKEKQWDSRSISIMMLIISIFCIIGRFIVSRLKSDILSIIRTFSRVSWKSVFQLTSHIERMDYRACRDYRTSLDVLLVWKLNFPLFFLVEFSAHFHHNRFHFQFSTFARTPIKL